MFDPNGDPSSFRLPGEGSSLPPHEGSDFSLSAATQDVSFSTPFPPQQRGGEDSELPIQPCRPSSIEEQQQEASGTALMQRPFQQLESENDSMASLQPLPDMETSLPPPPPLPPLHLTQTFLKLFPQSPVAPPTFLNDPEKVNKSEASHLQFLSHPETEDKPGQECCPWKKETQDDEHHDAPSIEEFSQCTPAAIHKSVLPNEVLGSPSNAADTNMEGKEFLGKEQPAVDVTEVDVCGFDNFKDVQKNAFEETVLDDRFEDLDSESPYSEHKGIGENQFKGAEAGFNVDDLALPSPKNVSCKEPKFVPDKTDKEFTVRVETNMSALVSPKEEVVEMQITEHMSEFLEHAREDIARSGSVEGIRKDNQDSHWRTSELEPLQIVEAHSVSDVKVFTENKYSSEALEIQNPGDTSVRNDVDFDLKSDCIMDWNQTSAADKTRESRFEPPSSRADYRKHQGQGTVAVDEFGRIKREGSDESDIDDPKRISRRRSRSRSRSWSPGWKSASRSPRRRGRHSRSFSRSPKRRKSHSRTPPQESRWAPYGRGDREFHERGRRGGRGASKPVCLDFTRGKCFRGSSCKYLHQENVGGPADFGNKWFSGNRNRGWREIDYQQNWSTRSATPPVTEGNVDVKNTSRKAQDALELQHEHVQMPQNLALENEKRVEKEEHSVKPSSRSPFPSASGSSLQKQSLLQDPASSDQSLSVPTSKLQPSPSPVQGSGSVFSRNSSTQSPSGTPLFPSSSNVQRAPFISKRANPQHSLPMRPSFPFENPQDFQSRRPFTSPAFRQQKPLFPENLQPFQQSHRPFTMGRQPPPATGDSFPPRAPFSANHRAHIQPIYPPSRPNQTGMEINFPQQHVLGPPVSQSMSGPSHTTNHPKNFSGHEPQFQRLETSFPVTATIASRPRNFKQDFNSLPQWSSNPRPEHGLRPFSQQGSGSLNEQGSNHFQQQGFKSLPQENFKSRPERGNFPEAGQNSMPVASMHPSFQEKFNSRPERGNFPEAGHNSMPVASMHPSFQLRSSIDVTSMQSSFPATPGMRSSMPVTSMQPSFHVMSPMASSMPVASMYPSFPVSSSIPSSMPVASMQSSFPVTSVLNSMTVASMQSFPVTSVLGSNSVAPLQPSFSVASMLSSMPVSSRQPSYPATSFHNYMPTISSMQSPISATSMSTSVPVASTQSSFLHAFAGESSSNFMFPEYANTGGQSGLFNRSSIAMEIPKAQNIPPLAVSGMVSGPGSLGTQTAFIQSLPPSGSAQALAYNSSLPGISALMGLMPAQQNQGLGNSSARQYDHLANITDLGLSSVPIARSLKPTEANFGLQNDSLGDGLVGNPETIIHNTSVGLASGNIAAKLRGPDQTTATGIGVVENVSPPDDNENWSPGQPVEGATATGEMELGQDSKKNKEGRGMKLLRAAVTEYVKEVLKPTWRDGQMSKEAFKTITKKAVEKVTGNIPTHHVPKSQDKVDQYMSSSRSKIAKLVQGYVDKYLKT